MNSNTRSIIAVAVVILLGIIVYFGFLGGTPAPTPATTTTTPAETTQPATNNTTPAQ